MWKDSEEEGESQPAFEKLRNPFIGTSLVVQGLRLLTFTAESMGLTPGRGTKIPHAICCAQKSKKERNSFLEKGAEVQTRDDGCLH